MKTMERISPKAYRSDGFAGKYQELVRKEMIPYQYRVLRDEADNTERSGVFSNYINAGKALRGEKAEPFYGMVFQDSDAAKWIEAAAYSLAAVPDSELERETDELIDLIAAAQDEDGYLDTRFTISDREKRWTNLLEAHELYCAGHMMEAACAYYESTGKRKLLDVMEKNAEHIYRRFIEDGAEGYPGHPEIELALLKMYRAAGNSHCLELAKHFIDCRGVDPGYYEKEKEKRDWFVWGNNPVDYDYQQNGKPVREQTDATGHAVRAVYLYTGMADLASETDDRELFAACRRLWESIVNKRMYITGGIGSTVHGEAFSVDYDLPSDTAYSETCAAIGLMFFASRMLENEVNGEYGDVMEQAFYNTVLAGIQLDGKRFFYVNPLESLPGISGKAPTHRHALTTRPGWYACACCPPNASRLISSLGQYAYGEKGNTVFCNLYVSGDVTFSNGMKLRCETGYPYDFEIRYIVSGEGIIGIRIPHWSEKYTINKNGSAISPEINKGYVYIPVSDGDTVRLSLDGTPRFVYPSEKIPALSGKTSLCRGPLVYCFEGADNGGDVISLSVDPAEEVRVGEYDGELLGGTRRLTAKGYRREPQKGLYSSSAPKKTPCDICAVPYCLWGNRGENQMRVWMDIR
ncbi:MAG: glycoside hydrolase family 127 protein [Oscillospiraceae bacterium]|nr:glycoside hydrolase family 127 protein [Oscillospiraceae bacterium]